MKKTLFALIMSVIMIGLASCGGTSKAFKECKQVLDGVMEKVQNAQDCDELDMATFGILALLGVEGIETMSESEQEKLSKISEEIDKVLEEKKAEFNCPEEEWYDDDDDLPMDELFEEYEEDEMMD